MKNDEMLNLCKKVVVDYYNNNVEKSGGLKYGIKRYGRINVK